MKRKWQSILALTLTGLLVFGGCTNTGGDDNTEDPGTATEDPVVEEPEDEALVHIPLILHSIQQNGYESDYAYTSANYVYPEIADDEMAEKYSALAEGLGRIKTDRRNDFEEMLLRLEEEAEDYLDRIEDAGAYEDIAAGMTCSHTTSVMRSDSSVVSILDREDFNIYGAVHPSYSYTGFTLDAKTGEGIELSDLVTDEDAFLKLLDEKLQTEYPDDYETFNLDTAFNSIQDLEDNTTWVMDSEGYTVIFNVYTIASYAQGAQFIRISFDEADGILANTYAESMDSYFVPWIDGSVRTADFDGDGTEDTLAIEDTLETVMSEDESGYYDAYTTTIRLNDEEFRIEEGFYPRNRYLLRANGQYYLYLFQEYGGDDENLVVFDLKEKNEKSQESFLEEYSLWVSDDVDDDSTEYEDISYPFVDPSSFRLGSNMYLMGTIDGYKTYAVGSDGVPVSEDADYTIETLHVMRSTQDISTDQVDVDGSKTDDGTIPGGSYLRYVRSDNETYVDVQIIDESKIEKEDTQSELNFYRMETYENPDMDDVIYRIYPIYNEDIIENTINDIPESELFEGVFYAG